nr:CsgG/HfaB family protein [uncultured Desulfobacter sp.]
MKILRRTVTVMAALLLTFGWVGTKRVQAFESGNAEVNIVPKTLAILPFENNSVTDSDRYTPLSKGLSAMLITDLSKNGTSMKLIERGKIASLLKEIALSQGGAVDDSTAVQAGKILGAQCIAFGSFMVIAKQVRIDTRIIKVETSELIMAESIVGKTKNFMTLEQDLAQKIAESLNVALKTQKSNSGSDIEAALYFSKGLDALDKGDKTAARQLFKKCIKLDPAYKTQVDNIQDLKL